MHSADRDLNEEVLQRLRDSGDRLVAPRPVEFTHVFADSATASAFAMKMHPRGFETAVEESACVPELPWDVIVTVQMTPELDALTATELELAQVASEFGGRADGWQCGTVVDR